MIYAVNMRTKEHREWNDALAHTDDWIARLADADGWIKWQDGECPLPLDQPCEAKTRNGDSMKFSAAGSVVGWKREIAYYRPILDAKPDAPMPEQGTDATTPRRPFLDSGRLRERFGPFDVSPPAWDGEGLPPAGIRCEALRSHGWVEVYVVGYCEDGYCVFDTGSDFKGNKDPNKFRPLRSEEDRSVDEMIAAAGLDDEGYNRAVCRDLLRAGYRKAADGEDV